MPLTQDGINARTGSAAPGATPLSMAPRPRPTTVEEQVAGMTVADVIDAIDAGEISTSEAVAAERAGRQRTGILALGDDPDGEA